MVAPPLNISFIVKSRVPDSKPTLTRPGIEDSSTSVIIGLMKYCLRILIALGWLLIPAGVMAATTITSPAEGECLKGNSAYTIRWSWDDVANNHEYVSYAKGVAPTPYAPGESGLSHNATGTNKSLNWTTPNETSSDHRLRVEQHQASHAEISSDVNTFNVDNSGPQAFQLNITAKTQTSVSLSWTTSADSGCMGLIGYRVYRNDQQIKAVLAGTTTFMDTGLTAGTTYTYKVQAYDDFASIDTASKQSTTDGTAPGAPTTSKPAPDQTPTDTPSTQGESSEDTNALEDAKTLAAEKKLNALPYILGGTLALTVVMVTGGILLWRKFKKPKKLDAAPEKSHPGEVNIPGEPTAPQ